MIHKSVAEASTLWVARLRVSAEKPPTMWATSQKSVIVQVAGMNESVGTSGKNSVGPLQPVFIIFMLKII